MEEIVKKIDELINEIGANTVPLWLSIIGIFVPILISIIVLWQGCRQNKRNLELQQQITNSEERLQKEISTKEIKVQMHGDFLKIYDDFCIAQNVIGKAKDNMSNIFANPNISLQWTNDLINANNGVCQAMNRARLLLPTDDKEFLDILRKVFEKYRELTDKVIDYIDTGAAEFYRNQTWGKITQSYNICYGDYMALANNPLAGQDFMKLYSNKEIQALNDMIKEILPFFEYDAFDKYFEKYLRIEA